MAMIIKGIVYEKERRLKEVMKVMGLSNGVHWLAWLIDSFLVMFTSCVLLVLVLKVRIGMDVGMVMLRRRRGKMTTTIMMMRMMRIVIIIIFMLL